jgi:hypothetical protein
MSIRNHIRQKYYYVLLKTVIISLRTEDQSKWSLTEMHLLMSSLSTLYNILEVINKPELIGKYYDFMLRREGWRPYWSDLIYPYISKEFFQYDVERYIPVSEIVLIQNIQISSPGQLDIYVNKNEEDFSRLLQGLINLKRDFPRSDSPKETPDIQKIKDAEAGLDYMLVNDKAVGLPILNQKFGKDGSEVYATAKREIAILSSLHSARKWNVTTQ